MKINRFLNNFVFEWHSYKLAYLIEGMMTPIAEPIQHTTIKQSRRRAGPILEAVLARVHCEDHMQISHHFIGEPLVQLLGRVEHETVSGGALFALSHQRRVLVSLE